MLFKNNLSTTAALQVNLYSSFGINCSEGDKPNLTANVAELGVRP